MYSLKYLITVLALVGCALAIKCYYGTTKNKDKPPKSTRECNHIKYCVKETKKSGKDRIHEYGCPETVLSCMKVGCETKNDVTRCCCNKDLCNGSNTSPVLLSFIPLIVTKMIL
ncbi:unnamed protein product [Cylicocyclus nassatus]|uniref:Uncharacterized protein n=1 Tax=Cylicocyclus nassatus TaxID=53992 RepID=A0AA36DNE1_CYLNA|nr:unnamed protein product [Cylicocyclus nassatus]